MTNLSADIRSFVQEYREGHRDAKTLISRDGLETRRHVSTAIQGTDTVIKRVGQDLYKLALDVDAQVDQAKHGRLLRSLKYPGFNERRNEVREAHPATFRWVFAGDDGKSAGPDSKISTIKWDSFSNWLKSTDTVYWISGKPGSGKSTIVKYILTDPQIKTTKQCLDTWLPGCLIISHFFWRPGNLMQRSTKGLLCSLLFQLLEKSETALARVLASVIGSSMKDDVTDWSPKELQSTLLSTMEAYDRPVCMFLDGLDEVYPDQCTTLLDMIEEISRAGKTKICLASRPEPPLQRRLYNIPQLRLQDLTAADLAQYVYDHIQASNFPSLRDYEYFAQSLVRQAEGVFLWLVLVTRSVRAGFDNGDTIDIIKERFEGLQGGDLESLYKDMWNRVSKDNPDTYRRTAALYFRIMLLYNRNRDLQVYGSNLGVFTMMLASTKLAEKTLNAAPQTPSLVPEETLLQGCKEVERMAEIFCFGLLEVSGLGHDTIEDMVGWYRGSYDRLLPYAQARRVLVFIHRSAVDFLLDTAQGREILSFEDTAESSLAFRLVTANLAHAELFCDLSGIGATGSLASNHLKSIDHQREVYVDADESVTADYKRTMIQFKRLCDLEKVFAGDDSTKAFVCSGVDFFKAVAMYRWRCLDIFETQIKTLDKETLSDILYSFCTRFDDFSERHEGEDFDGGALRLISLLFTCGADPNWSSTTAFANINLKKNTIGIRWQTPFVAVLSQMLLQCDVHLGWPCSDWPKHLDDLGNDLSKILVTLQTFVHYGADLNENVTIVVECDQLSRSIPAKSSKLFQRLSRLPLSPWEDLLDNLLHDEKYRATQYTYVCSLPAHDILNLVLCEWENLRVLPNGMLLEDFKSLVADGACSSSRTNDSVLERFEFIDSAFPRSGGGQRAESRWCVAPPEHQKQIAKELINLSVSKTFVNMYGAKPNAEIQELGYETLTSLLCGPHWVEMGSGCSESFFDHLLGLRIIARHSVSREFHTVQDWLKMKAVLRAT